MKVVSLTCIKEFPYAGRILKPGDPIEVPLNVALVMTHIGLAKYPETPIEKPKRRYKRRDMKAEE